MGNRLRVCALEKQQNSQVALGVYIFGINRNNGLKFGGGKVRLVLTQIRLSLFCVRFDLFPAAGGGLGKAVKDDKEDCGPQQNNRFSCLHVASIRRMPPFSLASS